MTDIQPGDIVCLRLRLQSTQHHPYPLPGQPIIVESLITYPTAWSIRQGEPHFKSYVGSPGAICCWQDKDRRWHKREFPIEKLQLIERNPNPVVEYHPMAGFVSPRLEALFSRIREGTGTISQMNDREVLQCGFNAMDTTDPRKTFNPGFKIQLLAARAEWLRRYPRTTRSCPFHRMNFVGSTVIARLKYGALDRKVIAKIAAVDNGPAGLGPGKVYISFGAFRVKIDYAQIIKII
jgi:hypothetical protein